MRTPVTLADADVEPSVSTEAISTADLRTRSA